MSEKIRIGNTYHHDEHGHVLVTHHDQHNNVWFRGVQSEDNAGVVGTTQWVDQADYRDFLGSVTMDDYPPEDNWQALRRVVLRRDDYRCQGCGSNVTKDPSHVHHIVPLGAGGTNRKSNLITLCETCHGRVHGGVT